MKQAVQKAFSKSACSYDAHADLQREIGQRLLQLVSSQANARYVLDCGCGTGWMFPVLMEKFPGAKVMGCDFALGMVQRAQEQNRTNYFLAADAAALPFRKQSIDYIVSNLAFQWMHDLSSCFCDVYFALRPKGRFIFSGFGRASLRELHESFEQTADDQEDNGKIFQKIIVHQQQVSLTLKEAGFSNIICSTEIAERSYDDLFHLSRWLQGIGAHRLPKNKRITKNWFLRANDYYKDHYGNESGIKATFEVIWAQAEK